MRLLLDTHALLWWLRDSDLSQGTEDIIADQGNLVFVSAATVWEIAIKRQIGKLEMTGDLLEQLSLNDFEHLPISAAHALLAGDLPLHHRDPFDRMLIAQAQVEDLTVVTRDERFSSYGVRVLPA